jgi:hypothetical protein
VSTLFTEAAILAFPKSRAEYTVFGAELEVGRPVDAVISEHEGGKVCTELSCDHLVCGPQQIRSVTGFSRFLYF